MTAAGRPTPRRWAWVGRLAYLIAASATWAALCAGLWLLLGCYNLVSVNVGLNRSAGAVAAPLTPEAYCAALAARTVDVRGKAADQPPELTTEQKAFCAGVVAAKTNKRKAKPAPEQKGDSPQ